MWLIKASAQLAIGCRYGLHSVAAVSDENRQSQATR
jgi:hypothetical protein